MKIKPGASLAGLRLPMRAVLRAAETIWKSLGRPEGVTVTSGTDGEHSAGSLHYYGYAVDLRTHYFDASQVEQAARALRLRLTAGEGGYDVIVEPTHIHVEYQAAADYFDRPPAAP